MFRNKNSTDKPVINLDGPDGNVFALMGYAKNWARDLGLDANQIIAEMMESDYPNALGVIEKHFGDFVIFETENQHLLPLNEDARVQGAYEKYDS